MVLAHVVKVNDVVILTKHMVRSTPSRGLDLLPSSSVFTQVYRGEMLVSTATTAAITLAL